MYWFLVTRKYFTKTRDIGISGIVFKKCISLSSIPIYAFNGRTLINLYNPHNMTENNDTQQIISIETEKRLTYRCLS